MHRAATFFFSSHFPSSNAFSAAFQFRFHKICAYGIRVCVCVRDVLECECRLWKRPRREDAPPSLTFRLVESLMPGIYAENGSHKCLSLSILNDKVGENEVKCSGILCVGCTRESISPFVRSCEGKRCSLCNKNNNPRN